MDSHSHQAQVIANISDLIANNKLSAFNCIDNQRVIFAIEKTKTNSTKHDYSIYIASENGIHHLMDVYNEKFKIHYIQLLNEYSLLLVSARSVRRSDTDFDRNGRIYSLEGNLQNAILLGDGIQEVQVTEDGKIWTSYFDEGVFGNYGWSDPIGAMGLIQWNAEGEKLYEFSPQDGLDHICDCYALNIESNRYTWCYYYTDFPLVKIKDGKITQHWTIPIRGSDAFAVSQHTALFRGGYDDHQHLYLMTLNDNQTAKIKRKIKLANISSKAWAVARGDAIFFFDQGSIYRVSVGEFF